jgi:hypothetical protein
MRASLTCGDEPEICEHGPEVREGADGQGEEVVEDGEDHRSGTAMQRRYAGATERFSASAEAHSRRWRTVHRQNSKPSTVASQRRFKSTWSTTARRSATSWGRFWTCIELAGWIERGSAGDEELEEWIEPRSLGIGW